MSSNITLTATVYNLWNNNFDGTTNAPNPNLGMFFRGNGYVYELLCDFDISSLAGATIESASIRFTVTGSQSGTLNQTVYAMEQNKTAPASWSSPPIYNDFGNFPGTHTYWDTELSNVANVLSATEYTINDTSDNIRDYVQSWINDSANNWGIVLTRDDNSTSRYVTLNGSQVYLDLTYSTDSDLKKKVFSSAGLSTFDVPQNVKTMIVKAWGGGAGGGAGGTAGVGGAGGGGGYVEGTIEVTPGETLQVHVGGAGGAGTYSGSNSGSGGGGGGQSRLIRRGTLLFVAGAGGGGGGGDNSTTTAGGAGGAGGGSTGGSGGNSSSSIGGGGGTQSAGGAGGTGGANVGEAGGAPNTTTFNNSLNFDGDPEYVDLGNDSVFNFTTNFSLECLVYIPSDHGQTGTMRFLGSRNADNGIGFGYVISSGYLQLTLFGKDDYESNQTVPLDEWVHCAVTITALGGTQHRARFYINSEFINSVDRANGAATTTGINMTLGQAGNDTEYFVGKLDDVRMWSDVRTALEIERNFGKILTGSEGNLVGYWKLNETSGTTANDETTNANDGTLTNMEDSDWVSDDQLPPILGSGYGGYGANGTNAATTKGGQNNGGTTNGGPGGTGELVAGFAGGGGGGAGYYGGGGGASSVASDAGGSGGGGGSSYIVGTAQGTTNSQATGSTPPNTSDVDYIGNVGVGGNGGATTTNGSAGNNGLIVLSWEGGLYGGMRLRSSESQYLSSVTSFTPPDEATVCCWVYDTTGSASVRRIMGCDNLWEIGLNVNNRIFNDLKQNDATNFTSVTALSPFTLYHIACNVDSSANAKIYINGELDATASINDGTPSSNILEIGHTADATGEYWDGYIEDLRVYNRVLSEAEIKTIYACKGTDGIKLGLLHRYPINEKSINAIADGTGVVKDWGSNSLNMTPNNSPTYVGTINKYQRFY